MKNVDLVTMFLTNHLTKQWATNSYQLPKTRTMESISFLLMTCLSAESTLHPPWGCRLLAHQCDSSTLQRKLYINVNWVLFKMLHTHFKFIECCWKREFPGARQCGLVVKDAWYVIWKSRVQIPLPATSQMDLCLVVWDSTPPTLCRQPIGKTPASCFSVPN